MWQSNETWDVNSFYIFCWFWKMKWPHHMHSFLSLPCFIYVNNTFCFCYMDVIWKLSAQIITFEHEGNWTRALEYYDLQARSQKIVVPGSVSENIEVEQFQPTTSARHSVFGEWEVQRQPFKGLIKSLQQTGCMHVLDLYCQGLTSREGCFQYDPEFIELQVCILIWLSFLLFPIHWSLMPN